MLLPNRIYHIWHHANSNENLFHEEENYDYFLKLYSKYILPVAETYAYCLMPNHYHFVVKFHSTKNLPLKFRELADIEMVSKKLNKAISNMNNAYTKAFNKKYERKGNLFRRGFNYREIRLSKDFKNIIIYAHKNPVHHGFTDDYYEWKYSSIHSYLGDRKSHVKTSTLLIHFDHTEMFKEAHNHFNIQDIGEDIEPV